MASAGSGGSLPPNFLLTPQQQSLLFAALNSNKQPLTNTAPNSASSSAPADKGAAPPDAYGNPALIQNRAQSGLSNSEFADNFDYSLADSSFDFSFHNDLDQSRLDDKADSSKSESPENDGVEKRSHPDDEDDDGSPGNDSKRRESTEKVPKKPGRKPLTSEPSSKRKAQNRAAQRAFRERKEKHLKDLETKVEELEKASEAANHENGVLRDQVKKMTAELNQYKQKATLMSVPNDRVKSNQARPAGVNHMGDTNFQFEFPKFGVLPGPAQDKQNGQHSPQKSNSSSPKSSIWGEKTTSMAQQLAQNAQFNEDLAKFAGMLTPSMSSSGGSGSRASVDSGHPGSGAATSSPASSSQYNMGSSSSCGTSPEPLTQSPTSFKPVDTLSTIGEEHSFSNFGQYANSNTEPVMSNFDWLAQQNGGQFEPQLFGDYREPQENVLQNLGFDDFFNDALNADFFTPYMAPSPNMPKTNLIEQIDAQQNSADEIPPASSARPYGQGQGSEFWHSLQSCPHAQSGDFDLDGLCSELTKKAKCSGAGPVVGESDFDTILKKYARPQDSADCVAKNLGITVESDPQPNQLSTPPS